MAKLAPIDGLQAAQGIADDQLFILARVLTGGTRRNVGLPRLNTDCLFTQCHFVPTNHLSI